MDDMKVENFRRGQVHEDVLKKYVGGTVNYILLSMKYLRKLNLMKCLL
jgi:hypothetical protein